MNLSTSSDRKTLRDLPAAAKLVVTAFLVAVGIGYFWAMVQLHFKHGGNGEPMPTVADTVAHFSGREWPLEDQPAPPPRTEQRIFQNSTGLSCRPRAFR